MESNFLENIFTKENIIIIIIIILIFHIYYKFSNIKENMANLDSSQKDEIINLIYQTYKIDVNAIKNLSEIASKLIKDGILTVPGNLSIPGNLTISGKLNVNGEVITNGEVNAKNNLNVSNLNVSNSFNLLPRGSIIAWSGTIVPTGWIICDGSNNTPDLRGRFILGSGQGSGLTNRILNEKGGSEIHTLTIDEIPKHSHQVYDGYYAEDMNWLKSKGVLDSVNSNKIFDKNGLLTDTKILNNNQGLGTNSSFDLGNQIITQLVGTEQVGGSKSHNNMSPYYVLTYIMRL